MSRGICLLQTIVIFNVLFYTVLRITLVSAFIAVLIKSRIREFDCGVRAISALEQQVGNSATSA